ncbi:hypothetical protein [Bradyrhizobium sp. UFLA05-112]
MPKPSLPFLHRYRSRSGKKWRYYVQLDPHAKGRGVRIGTDHLYRGEQFMAEYHAAVPCAPIIAAPIFGKGGKGTVKWLIDLYRASRAWTDDIGAGTRKQRGPIYKQMEANAGDLPLSAITRAKVEEGMKARTKNQSRHFFNAIKQLFKWAIENNDIDFNGRNPCDGIKPPRNDSKEVEDWAFALAY